jgi:hypothetical protein
MSQAEKPFCTATLHIPRFRLLPKPSQDSCDPPVALLVGTGGQAGPGTLSWPEGTCGRHLLHSTGESCFSQPCQKTSDWVRGHDRGIPLKTPNGTLVNKHCNFVSLEVLLAVLMHSNRPCKGTRMAPIGKL